MKILRELGGFSRACLSNHDDDGMAFDLRNDFFSELEDGQFSSELL